MPAEWAQAEALDSPPHPARGPGESLRQPCAECESPTTQQTWQVSAYDDRFLDCVRSKESYCSRLDPRRPRPPVARLLMGSTD